MKYVLDSSVALKWVLPEPDVSKAVQLRDDYHNGVHELLAPDIFPVETLHALTKAERRQRIAPANGWTLWQSLLADAPAMHSHVSQLGRAYQIASAARIARVSYLFLSTRPCTNRPRTPGNRMSSGCAAAGKGDVEQVLEELPLWQSRLGESPPRGG